MYDKQQRHRELASQNKQTNKQAIHVGDYFRSFHLTLTFLVSQPVDL